MVNRKQGREASKVYAVKQIRGPFVELPTHPDACQTPDEMVALSKRLDGPFAADLFCGAGGLSLGLQRSGYEVLLGIDNDKEALETHSAHTPGLSMNLDMAEEANVELVADMIEKAGISLVAGGPPCQPFSRAGRSMIRDLVRTGRREQHDGRRDLWQSFIRIVALSRPEAVLMENVPDMALDKEMLILRTMSETLEELGYAVRYRLIDTFRYGVPQFRQRLILVALRDGLIFHWPEESRSRVTVQNAIGDLPEIEGGWRPEGGAKGWAAYDKPVTEYQKMAREGVKSEDVHKVFDHITRPVREDDAAAFAQMDHTTRYSDLDPSLKRYRDDIFDDKYKRLDENDLSRTITAHIAKDGYWYIHPHQDRTLSVREAARLQTFPDWFRFAGSPSSAFRQIGNAVPPALGEVLGKAVLVSLRRADKASMTTQVVSGALSSWFLARETTRVPWLSSNSKWLVIQSELLWNRLGEELIQLAWTATKHLDTPQATLESSKALGRLTMVCGRSARFKLLLQTAKWFAKHPGALEPESPASELLQAPNVTQVIADLASRVSLDCPDDVVLAKYGVLRVASRFQGLNVDKVNRMSEGRLAVARMIGGGDSAHGAHLALMELANGICGPGTPECARCPLRDGCKESATGPLQLSFTNPAGQPTPENVS
ncbi:MAG: DNA (cytosine-5-)-methyltransferase [Actinobacteria bacterium]|nr:DNA (cytosine-5-)-methyltransferase [Actinomycetota bacterium]